MVDFLGIGAQKAGTTWLHTQLARHPQVRFAPMKEVHFWDKEFKRGYDWYASLFPEPSDEYRCGEITPAYAILPPSTIREIKDTYPNVKLFYILRDPIERAWSAALMALRNADMKIDEASDQWFIDHFQSHGSRMRTDYETSLRNWLSVFPPQQVLVLDYRHIITNPMGLMQQLAQHLDIDPYYYTQNQLAMMKERVFGTEERIPIRPELLPFLEAMHQETQMFYQKLFK